MSCLFPNFQREVDYMTFIISNYPDFHRALIELSESNFFGFDNPGQCITFILTMGPPYNKTRFIEQAETVLKLDPFPWGEISQSAFLHEYSESEVKEWLDYLIKAAYSASPELGFEMRQKYSKLMDPVIIKSGRFVLIKPSSGMVEAKDYIIYDQESRKIIHIEEINEKQIAVWELLSHLVKVLDDFPSL
jgi:hypothetical protein